MKKSVLLRLTLISLTALIIHNANAGSAVVWDGGRNLTTSYGHPVEIAKQRALQTAHLLGWSNVRIFGFTDQTGYGAIAVARHPNGHGAIVAAALGKRSATEAHELAIQHCLQAGGTDPKVISQFRG
jgi:hypothetical protein